MKSIEIETVDASTSWRPGETLEGTVSWRFDRDPKSVELRLFWYTEGKGDQDVEVVSALAFENLASQDRRTFRFSLPAGPYSFSGKLISLTWALEAIVMPGTVVDRLEISVSPTGREILLQKGSVGAQGESPG